MWRCSMPGTERGGASAKVRRATSDDEDVISSGLDGRTAAGRGAGGDLDRARQLREGAHDTESPRLVSGVHSEGTGAGRRGKEGRETREEEVRNAVGNLR
jgi:hypothetical protein